KEGPAGAPRRGLRRRDRRGRDLSAQAPGKRPARRHDGGPRHRLDRTPGRRNRRRGRPLPGGLAGLRRHHPCLHPFRTAPERLSRARPAGRPGRRRRRLVAAARDAFRRGLAHRHEEGNKAGCSRSICESEVSMSNVDIRHIVFDIGKVLIHYDPHLPFSRIIPDTAEREWFFANLCTHEWNMEQDRGRTWEEAETLLIADHPARQDHIRAFRKRWREMVPHAYDDSVAIMTALIDEGRDVTMLTNFAADTF